MPEDEVTTQGPPESQRALEVDAIAGLEPAERRARERLGPELEDELVRRALDHRQARTVHGNARADVTALERHARLHAEPERGAGACERDDGPHFLDDPGEHLFNVAGSDAAPPDRPPPVTHGGPIRKSIAPAKPALERPHSDQPLVDVAGSDAAPPDRPPPVTHGGPIRKSIAPAKPAL